MAAILSIIAPVFVVISLGYILGRTRLFSGEQDHAGVLINFVWYVAIPFYLLKSLASRPLPNGEELLIILVYYMALYLVYAIALLVARFAFRQPLSERPVFAFVVCFGNGAFLGIPLIHEAYGEEGVRLLLIILSFHTLTLLPLSTFLLERAKVAEAALGGEIVVSLWRRSFDSIKANPILLSLIIGLLWSALHIPFPVWLGKVMALPAAAAAPVGLFAVGLSMSSVRLAGNLFQAAVMAGLKLVVLPVFVFCIGHFLLRLPETWVGVATLCGCLPSGMVAYSFARRYQIAERRAASAVLLSTTMSIFTMSFALWFLGRVG